MARVKDKGRLCTIFEFITMYLPKGGKNEVKNQKVKVRYETYR